jgi:hypothetical protein
MPIVNVPSDVPKVTEKPATFAPPGVIEPAEAEFTLDVLVNGVYVDELITLPHESSNEAENACDPEGTPEYWPVEPRIDPAPVSGLSETLTGAPKMSTVRFSTTTGAPTLVAVTTHRPAVAPADNRPPAPIDATAVDWSD